MEAFVEDQDHLETLVWQRVYDILVANIPKNNDEFQYFTLKLAHVEHFSDNGTAATFGGEAAWSFNISEPPLISTRFNFSSSGKLL
jgi:hypothetical protein